MPQSLTIVPRRPAGTWNATVDWLASRDPSSSLSCQRPAAVPGSRVCDCETCLACLSSGPRGRCDTWTEDSKRQHDQLWRHKPHVTAATHTDRPFHCTSSSSGAPHHDHSLCTSRAHTLSFPFPWIAGKPCPACGECLDADVIILEAF